MCGQRFPTSILASLAQYLKLCGHFFWHLSKQQYLLNRSWGCFLQGIKVQLLPLD